MNLLYSEANFSRQLADRLTDLRVQAPELLPELAGRRVRRPTLAPDGRLVIIAADHPARGVVAVGSDSGAMANRAGYLSRIARVLGQPEVDGLMATADLIDEVLLLNHLVTEAGGPDLLAGKLLVGSMNRGGLAGTRFELDDTMTGYTAEGLAEMGLDGGKLLLRLHPEEPDTARTLLYCAQAVEALQRRRLPIFLEPLPVEPIPNGGWRVQMAAEELIRVVGVATALGSSTAGLWLKLPMAPELSRVAAATTCPILLLGGDSGGDPQPLFARLAASMEAGANVRGCMIGRSVLYPGLGVDPATVAIAVSRMVRGSMTAREAVAALPDLRGQDPLAAVR
ncbi:MAG TPA: deoxyribose-phosphate aldolase [Symbiobacteriaceae bacterium]|nr:deoxyribose-phosphate aldolase [Symbiobacteriaceae bacterium]